MKSRIEELRPHQRFLETWGQRVVKRRWLCVAATLVVTAAMLVITGQRLQADTSTEKFLASGSDEAQALETLRDEFGMDAHFQVVASGDVFSPGYLTKLQALHEALEGIDVDAPSLGLKEKQRAEAKQQPNAFERGDTEELDTSWGAEAGSVVDQVTSLINVRKTVSQGGSLAVVELLETLPPAAELPKLKQDVLADPNLVDRLVATNGEHSVLLVRTGSLDETDEAKVYSAILDVARAHSGDGFDVQVGGLPALNASLNGAMQEDFGKLFLLCLLLMIIILSVLFRSVFAVVGPLLVVIQSAIWTLGAMALFGVPLTMVSNILPAFLLCVGIGDAVHLQASMRTLLGEGMDVRSAVVAALARTGRPIVLTTVTTALGLLSFQLASLPAIRDMGLFGAVGACAALLNSLVFLPAMLSFHRGRLGAKASPRSLPLLDRVLAFCNTLSRPEGGSYARRNLLLTAVVLMTGVSVVGISRLTTEHDPLTWLPDHFAVKRAFSTVDGDLGGSASVRLLIQTPEGKTLKDAELLTQMQALERHLEAYQGQGDRQGVTGVSSVLDVLRESNQAIHEGDPQHYVVPKEQGAVEDLLTLFENADPDELSQLATLDLRTTIMTAQLPWMDSDAYAPLAAHIDAGVKENIGSRASVYATGTVYSIFSTLRVIISDLLRSFGAALLSIGLVMLVALRSIRLGLAALVPNLLPIFGVLGMMGFMGIPLDVGSLLLASIVIGIAVDDTIHVHHHFLEAFKQSGDREAALTSAFRSSGPAIVATSLVLAVGFGVFLTSELTNLQRFGGLIAAAVVSALVADLVVAPALIRCVYPGRKGPAAESKALDSTTASAA